MKRLLERCAALDVHKKQLAVARPPGAAGEVEELNAEFSTMASQLLALRDWLKVPTPWTTSLPQLALKQVCVRASVRSGPRCSVRLDARLDAAEHRSCLQDVANSETRLDQEPENRTGSAVVRHRPTPHRRVTND